jgi:hypothetical protein
LREKRKNATNLLIQRENDLSRHPYCIPDLIFPGFYIFGYLTNT